MSLCADMLSVQPDVTQTVVTVQHQQHPYHHHSGTNSTSNSADSPNNNHMGTLDKSPPSYLPPDPPYTLGVGVGDLASGVSPSDNLYSVPNAHFNLPSPGDLSQGYLSDGKLPGGSQHRLSGGTLSRTNKTVFVEPTIKHNLNTSIEKLTLVDTKAGLPPPPPAPESHSRPASGHSDSLQGSRQSVISVQLPGNVDSEAVTWNTFNYAGGRLVLPESGEPLTIYCYCVHNSVTMFRSWIIYK